MTELLRNAWNGWQDHIHYSKFAALFLAAVCYMIFRRRKEYPAWRLVVYSAVMGVLCIFPPAAAVLMLYQTRFFDYAWIWSYVPVTAMIALGGTLFLTDFWKKWGVTLKNMCYDIALAGMLLGVILLSGSLGRGMDVFAEESIGHGEAVQILKSVRENCGEGEVCLWAPREVLEYARAEDGDISLLYGRDMWDVSLNAYSYDTYSEEMETLYQWIEQFEETGEKENADFAEDGAFYVQRAIDLGATCILLPETVSKEEFTDWELMRVDRYYMIQVPGTVR